MTHDIKGRPLNGELFMRSEGKGRDLRGLLVLDVSAKWPDIFVGKPKTGSRHTSSRVNIWLKARLAVFIPTNDTPRKDLGEDLTRKFVCLFTFC